MTGPTFVLVTRHPDHENFYDVLEGDEPGVHILDIDTGADFSNGRPSRYWCAERYFGAVDNEPMPVEVKRKLLATYKSLADTADKYPKGEDPGSW